jgi:predicted dithiol-disulfide oxidoreductase (DUF899 family)
MEQHKIVTKEEWLKARKAHLAKEKDLTRQRDELNRQLRELPWMKVEKRYVFEGPDGSETLADLFAGRSQLIVQHFVFGPGWKEGCVGCSFSADHMDGVLPHLEHHDVSFVAVARAPLAEIAPFHKRMGWGFKWVSSYGSDFNYDYHVSFTKEEIATGKVYYNYTMGDFQSEEMSGRSVFYKDAAGDIFHTYSSYARGGDHLLGAYNYFDLTPKGRSESANMSDWVRHHDKYGMPDNGQWTGRYVNINRTEALA